jgi:anti-anti-sigma factor
MNGVTMTRQENKATVRPSGDLVAAGTTELRTVMKEAMGGGVSELVVDLADVQMVDSSGLGLLISAYNSLRKIDGGFAVINASGEILDLLKAMRIHQHFSVSGR